MPLDALEDLRTELRLLVGDPGGAGEHFSDDDLDRFLSSRRNYHGYERVPGRLTADSDYLRFEGPAKLDSSVVLYDSLGDVVPAGGYTADFMAGSFTFAVARDSGLLYLVGYSYDLHGAAADALRAWAASLKLEIDVSADGDSWSRSQKVKNLLELAKAYDGASSSGGGASASGGIQQIRQVRSDALNVRGARSTRRR